MPSFTVAAQWTVLLPGLFVTSANDVTHSLVTSRDLLRRPILLLRAAADATLLCVTLLTNAIPQCFARQ